MGNDNQDVFSVPSSPDNNRTSPTPVKSASRRRSSRGDNADPETADQDGEDKKEEAQTPARVGTRTSGRQRKTPKRYEEEAVTPSSRRKPAGTPSRSARATRSAKKPPQSPVEDEDELELKKRMMTMMTWTSTSRPQNPPLEQSQGPDRSGASQNPDPRKLRPQSRKRSRLRLNTRTVWMTSLRCNSSKTFIMTRRRRMRLPKSPSRCQSMRKTSKPSARRASGTKCEFSRLLFSKSCQGNDRFQCEDSNLNTKKFISSLSRPSPSARVTPCFFLGLEDAARPRLWNLSFRPLERSTATISTSFVSMDSCTQMTVSLCARCGVNLAVRCIPRTMRPRLILMRIRWRRSWLYCRTQRSSSGLLGTQDQRLLRNPL